MGRLLSFTAAFALAIAFVTSVQAGVGETDDWNKGNLIAHGDFTLALPGGLPKGWELIAGSPRRPDCWRIKGRS